MLRLKNWSIIHQSLVYLTHPCTSPTFQVSWHHRKKPALPSCLWPRECQIQVQETPGAWCVLPQSSHFCPHFEHNLIMGHWLSLQQSLFRRAPTSTASGIQGHTASKKALWIWLVPGGRTWFSQGKKIKASHREEWGCAKCWRQKRVWSRWKSTTPFSVAGSEGAQVRWCWRGWLEQRKPCRPSGRVNTSP